nr:hypothetical protein [Pseudomonas sp.]
METLNITYNFLVPVAFALVMRLSAHVVRGQDPSGAFSWIVCKLSRYVYAAVGMLSLVGQFADGRMEPSVHLHAFFMGWLVGMAVLHMLDFDQTDEDTSWDRGGLGQKRY